MVYRLRGIAMLLLALTSLGISGCTSGSTSSAPAISPAPSTSTFAVDPSSTDPSSTAPSGSTPAMPSTARVTTTVTSTRSGITSTAGPPGSTKEPASVEAQCPYLSADVVSEITGQHHGPTRLVAVKPQPMCLFYRTDGGLMGTVRVIKAANPAAAVAAVNQHVPVAGSQPASQPAGWVGGSVTSAGQITQDSSALSTYAVARGDIAIVAQENESPSLKARVLAVCAIYGLKLEAGPAPDYCSGTTG